MRIERVFFIMALSMALVISIASSETSRFKKSNLLAAQSEKYPSLDSELWSLHHFHRHRHHRRHHVTCNKNPRICRSKGSPGRTCCKKRCVDLLNDSINCGKCGRKCRFGMTCCGGRCVRVMTDNWNCGGCNNKCMNGSYCRFGMCGYA